MLLLFLLGFSIVGNAQMEFNKFNNFIKDSSILWASTFVSNIKLPFKNYSFYNYLYNEITNLKKPTYFFDELEPLKSSYQLIDTITDVIWEDGYVAIDHGHYKGHTEDYKTVYLKAYKDLEENIFIKEILYYKNNRLYADVYMAMPNINQFTVDSNKYFPFPKFVGFMQVNKKSFKKKPQIVEYYSSDTIDISNDYQNRAPQYLKRHYINKEYFGGNFLQYLQNKIVQPNKFIRLNDSTQLVKQKEADYFFYNKPMLVQVPEQNDITRSTFKDTVFYNDIYLSYTKHLVLKRKWYYDIANNILSTTFNEVHLIDKRGDYTGSTESKDYVLVVKVIYKKE